MRSVFPLCRAPQARVGANRDVVVPTRHCWHIPATHCHPRGHVVLQSPQCDVIACVSTHTHASSMIPSQHFRFGAQAGTHMLVPPADEVEPAAPPSPVLTDVLAAREVVPAPPSSSPSLSLQVTMVVLRRRSASAPVLSIALIAV